MQQPRVGDPTLSAWVLTPPSIGRPKGRFAPFAPPLMSNVRPHLQPSRSIEQVDPQSWSALSLLREAAIEARALYPESGTPNAQWPGNAPTPPRGVYLVAFVGGGPVACGALRPIDEQAVEIRRLFVISGARRQGHARALLSALERYAAGYGFNVMLLETGNRQSAAMALYESYGFERIAPFGGMPAIPPAFAI